MKHDDQTALRRQNAIYELIESMRAAQRQARISESKILRGGAVSCAPRATVQRVRRVGIWKGGC